MIQEERGLAYPAGAAVAAFSGSQAVPCQVRPMRKEDIAQVAEIDGEAFPSMWPPVNFQRELKNQMAHYVVACGGEKTVDAPEVEAVHEERGFWHLWFWLLGLFGHHRQVSDQPPPVRQFVLGFAGFWMMAGEAHLTSIAVREQYRRQGIGELLLICVIEKAIALRASMVTLEVRASNLAPQRLYARYGFTQVGLRHNYYSDNREDGVVMSTANIASPLFQSSFRQSKRAYSEKWGISLPQFTS